MLLFSNFTFANNAIESETKETIIVYEFEEKDFNATLETTCYDMFASAYNAWISLGHTAEVAHTRATRTLNACLEANKPIQDVNP